MEQILGTKIKEPSKVTDKENKFLVCIPDGLIGDDNLVEIKCPYKCRDTTMENLANNDPYFCLGLSNDGRLKLKKDHSYYYQVSFK